MVIKVNNKISRIVKQINDSQKKNILVWRGLFQDTDELDLLYVMTFHNDKDINVVPLIEIFRNKDNENIGIIMK